ncbi:vitelline membrane outer layer protein 1 homolog [Alligator mississippiensis]|uniref:vitelline membrane outer layer protein 1 homolog n=1 Tax=Alligator mississippiensis TaxID=8496 RepID=UPI0003D0881B|nr:vitelline membrane outer layer protein 1 homolog [Alligator mississippiensis]
MRYKMQSIKTYCLTLPNTVAEKMKAVAIVFLAALAYSPLVSGEPAVKANGIFLNRQHYSSISVANGGPWGTWTWTDMCPEHFYAMGFSIKVEEYGGADDDTALNGIRLYCINPNNTDSTVYSIESDSGKFGQWSIITWCPRGFLVSFQLKVETPQGIIDDTAANGIKFRCTSGAIIEGVGSTFGDYGGWSNTCIRGGICGIQTKLESYQGAFVDDTALNDVRFFCCD